MIDGKPGMIVSPNCTAFRKGMKGGFHYKRVQVAGSERFHDKPDKNKYSHVCEAGEYMALVAGEGDQIIKTPEIVIRSIGVRIPVIDRGASGNSTGWMQ